MHVYGKIYSATPTCANVYFILFHFICVLPWIVNGVTAAGRAAAVGCFSKLISLRCTCGWGDNAAGTDQKDSRSEGTFSKVDGTFFTAWFVLSFSDFFQTRRRDFAQELCGTAGGRRDDVDVLSLLSICLAALFGVKRNNLRRLYNLPHLITILTSLTAWS